MEENNDLKFLAARDSDLKVTLSMMESYYAEDGYPFSASASEAAFRRLLAEPAFGRVYLVKEQDEVIGVSGFDIRIQFRVPWHVRLHR